MISEQWELHLAAIVRVAPCCLHSGILGALLAARSPAGNLLAGNGYVPYPAFRAPGYSEIAPVNAGDNVTNGPNRGLVHQGLRCDWSTARPHRAFIRRRGNYGGDCQPSSPDRRRRPRLGSGGCGSARPIDRLLFVCRVGHDLNKRVHVVVQSFQYLRDDLTRRTFFAAPDRERAQHFECLIHGSKSSRKSFISRHGIPQITPPSQVDGGFVRCRF